MAGDWIPLRTDLLEDPAVVGIAVLTGLDEFSVVGRLVRIWSASSAQTSDGSLPFYTAATIDKIAQHDGFAPAMVEAGWLTFNEEGAVIPNFDRWLSKGAKRRILDCRRKRLSVLKAEKKRTTVEESTGYKKNPPAPQGGVTGAETRFEEFWKAYPRKMAKSAAKRAWVRLRVSDDLLKSMLSAIAQQKRSEQWSKNGGQFIPLPATWLNGGRWQDDLASLNAGKVTQAGERVTPGKEETDEYLRELRETRLREQEAKRA